MELWSDLKVLRAGEQTRRAAGCEDVGGGLLTAEGADQRGRPLPREMGLRAARCRRSEPPKRVAMAQRVDGSQGRGFPCGSTRTPEQTRLGPAGGDHTDSVLPPQEEGSWGQCGVGGVQVPKSGVALPILLLGQPGRRDSRGKTQGERCLRGVAACGPRLDMVLRASAHCSVPEGPCGSCFGGSAVSTAVAFAVRCPRLTTRVR